MKNLIKLFLVVIAITMATDALFAQNFGIKTGLNLSNMVVKDNYETYSDDFKMNPGFHLGATVEFPLTKMFSFETGLLLTTKGIKKSEEETLAGETYKYESKVKLLYLDIPLTAKASFDLGGVKLYGVFGPYLGVGLSGKSKNEVSYNGKTESDERDIKWGSDEDDSNFKRLDFGLTMGAGVALNSIQIGLTYSLGLANISPDTDGGYKVNNRVLGISVGYKFGRK